MKYAKYVLLSLSLLISFASFAVVGAITGSTTACPGTTTALSDSSAGGTWSSSNTAVGTISATGIVTALSSGTTTIAYITGSAPGDTATATFTVSSTPAVFTVSGGGSYCSGSTGVDISLSGSATGVTYRLFIGASIASAPISGTGSAVDFGSRTAAGVYTVVATTTSTGCTSSMSGSATITVNPAPNIHNVIGGGSYCSGGPGVVIGLDGSDTYVIYQLLNGGVPVGAPVGGTSTPISFGFIPGAATYTVLATSAGTGCIAVMTGSATVSVNALPVPFTVTGGGTYCGGGAGVPVGLTSSDTGVNYQLYVGGTAILEPYPVAGVGTALNLGLQTTAGIYTVVATSAITGCSNNMAGSATISITAPVTPSVSIAVAPGSTVCAGTTVTFTATPVNGGSAPVYSWFKNSLSVGTGNTYSYVAGNGDNVYAILTSSASCVTSATATSASITMHTAALPAIAGATGGCPGGTATLTDAAGGGTWSSAVPAVATINAATGVVTAVAPGITTIAYTLAACATTATFTVNALPGSYAVTGGGAYCGTTGARIGLANSASGINYQLYRGIVPIGAVVTGTGGAIDFGSQTAGTYMVLATDPLTGCSRNMTGTTTLSANPLPLTQLISGGGAYCSGGTGEAIALSSSQPGIAYQLYNGSAPVGISLSGTGGVLNFGYLTPAGVYSAIATNPLTGCSTSMMGTATISVHPLPNVYTLTSAGGYCAGGAGAHVSLSGSDIGIAYKLYLGTAYTGIQVYGNGLALDFGAQTVAGAYSVTGTDTATGCSSNMRGPASVVIYPLPVSYSVLPSASGYCPGGTGVHIILTYSDPGVNYQLFRSGTPVALTAGTGAAIDFGLQLAGTYTVIGTNTSTTCSATMATTGTVGIYPLPSVFNVTGGGSYCSGGTGVVVGLNASTIGISYQLYNGVTPVGSAIPGTGSPLSFGLQTAAGTYTITGTSGTGCTSNMTSSAVVTVIPSVVPSVTMSPDGNDTVCAGATDSFNAIAVNGGTIPGYQWYINATPVAGATSNSFISSSLHDLDSVSVSLTSSITCASPVLADAGVLVHAITVPAITGASAICLGNNTALADTLPGGTWSTGNPGVAIISTVGGVTGVVTGIAAGTADMTYMLGSGCYAAVTITVDAVPALTASATAAACGGNYDLMASGAATYSWTPSTGLSCTTCTAPVANPMATTTYTVTGASTAGCISTATVSVNGNRISGYISYSGTATDVFRVWLIQFSPVDSSLTAIDSTFTCMDGGTPYYEFSGKPAGSYMVKAMLLGTVPGTSGYIPTYSLSTPHWYAAAATTHTTATDTLHISMVYGTVPSGPGFIGGLISAGAGRGTAGDIPAQGMTVYLADAVSGAVLTYTYTDATGAYAFSNIDTGNYRIYPENYGFSTIPSGIIRLTSATDSSLSNNFRQFNNSRVIKPVVPSSINEVNANGPVIYQFTAFPNPASATLNLLWGQNDQGIARVVITDITGHDFYTAAINIDDVRSANPNAAPVSPIDVRRLSSGVYIIAVSITTAIGNHISYHQHIVIQ